MSILEVRSAFEKITLPQAWQLCTSEGLRVKYTERCTRAKLLAKWLTLSQEVRQSLVKQAERLALLCKHSHYEATHALSLEDLLSRVQLLGVAVPDDAIANRNALEELVLQHTPIGENKRPTKRSYDEIVMELVRPSASNNQAHAEQFPPTKSVWALPPAKKTRLSTEPDICEGKYLAPVGEEVIDGAIRRYIDATSGHSLRKEVCCVCARRLPGTSVEAMSTSAIPSVACLSPSHPHAQHTLTHGMLLHRSAINDDEGFVCSDCLRELRHGRTPPLSLANNMWLGDIPLELSVLTLPERVLIARYFPAAYIVKLYPKTGGAGFDPRNLTSGVRGNVTSYPLDVEGFAQFINGRKLPAHPRVLAATIGISFVGVNAIPEKVMRGLFSVSRDRVRSALVWLRANNPIYEDIEIDEGNIQCLPDGEVPNELRQITTVDENPSALIDEHGGYIPFDEDDSFMHNRSDITPVEDAQQVSATERANLVAVQAHGMVDLDASDVSDSTLMAAAMENTAESLRRVEKVNMQHGSSFVNEYPRNVEGTRNRFKGTTANPNHLLGAFPVLFPYGMGGFEVDRVKNVTYEKHARWALQYADDRFRADLQLVFQMFGVLVKRQVYGSTALRVKQATFAQNAKAFGQLTAADFSAASLEEERGLPFSNATIRSFRKHLSVIRSKVTGTDESRRGIRAQIWGSTVVHGPPAVWMTINPSDVHDPIAQFLSGEEIDLDAFDPELGPDSSTRSFNIASDPMAAAEFFHVTIRTLLKDILGISAQDLRGNSKIRRQTGILGDVKAYIGTVEAQGRGMLHLHLLLWLEDAPTSQAMTDALKREDFRQRVKAWLSKNITGDIAGLSTSGIEALPKRNDFSFSRPVDPASPSYATHKLEETKKLARSLLVHVCKGHGCLQANSTAMKCKRGAPFERSDEAWINELGEWGSKRLHPYVVGHNQTCLLLLRCNHDVKLLTNAYDTRGIVWYITLYATKKQQKHCNASAVLAKRLAFHLVQERKDVTVDALHQRMLNRCANALSREQEFSAPEVISYLMGWGDRYISHHYVTIYWDGVVYALKAAFPSLRDRTYRQTMGMNDPASVEELLGENRERTLASTTEGLCLRDQADEYAYRAAELEEFGYLDFFLNTYEHYDQASAERVAGSSFAPLPGARKQRARRVRQEGHETLPQFIGQWFPRRTVDAGQEMYSACMLALFKPWRRLIDLRGGHDSFTIALQEFMKTAAPECARMMDNIDYYYLSAEAANVSDSKAKDGPVHKLAILVEQELEDDDELHNILPLRTVDDGEITDEAMEDALKTIYTPRDRLFAQEAMILAHQASIFIESRTRTAEWDGVAHTATTEQLQQYANWEDYIKSYIRGQPLQQSGDPQSNNDFEAIAFGQSEQGPNLLADTAEPACVTDGRASCNTIVLNEDQSRAQRIIQNHMTKSKNMESPQQLLMIVNGCGGTGKSALIEAITESSVALGAAASLAKTATSGVAATRIGGSTVHSWAGLGITAKVETSNTSTLAKRARNILPTKYLIIDEFSMLTKKLLEALSEVCCETLCKGGICSKGAFGGINVILFGDLHQFPPVVKSGALYHINGANDPGSLGRHIFERFTTVVTLSKQMRVTDERWVAMLDRLRVGGCTAEDVQMLNDMVLTSPRCDVPNFDCTPWNAAVLITSRNSVRDVWNEAAVKKHCLATGRILYTCPAEDTTGPEHTPLTRTQTLKVMASGAKHTGRLASRTQMAIGMKAMVLLNIATEADLANGSRGEITDIVLDAREPTHENIEDGEIKLKYPPACIIFRLDSATLPTIHGLRRNEIPISPSHTSFRLTSDDGAKSTVKRRQYVITPAYAFTDYKAQGQTIEHVLVDLAEPKRNALDPFHAYVALSRSRGRSTMRLFRECPKRLLTEHPSESLRPEDTRIALLNAHTKEAHRQGHI